MNRDRLRRARREIDGLAEAGLDWVSLAQATGEVLAGIVPFDRSCWHTVDPGTVLFTGSLAISPAGPGTVPARASGPGTSCGAPSSSAASTGPPWACSGTPASGGSPRATCAAWRRCRSRSPKTGVRSRSELVGQIFLEHYVTRWEDMADVPTGWLAMSSPIPAGTDPPESR